MSLVTEALAAVDGEERRLATRQAELDENLKLALKARVFDVFALSITLDQIEDLAVEIDGLRFTVIPVEPTIRAQLGVVQSCSDCEQPLLVPVNSILELGMILRGSQAGLLYCEACSVRHQPDYDPPAGESGPTSSLERFLVALQDVLVDYSLGGESILADLRQLTRKDSDVHPAP